MTSNRGSKRELHGEADAGHGAQRVTEVSAKTEQREAGVGSVLSKGRKRRELRMHPGC